MKKKFKLSGAWTAVKKGAVDFNNDNGFKLAASLSFSVVFAMGPLVILVISLVGIFWGRDAVEGRIYHQIRGLVGNGAAVEIQEIIKYTQRSRHTVAGAIFGGIIVVLGATGVFTEIQSSLNYIWSVQAKPKKGWLKVIMNRLLSFSLIVAFGFISMVSLLVNSLMDLLSDWLQQYFSQFTVVFFYWVNIGLTLGASVVLFMIVFRVLPDATIRWKDAFVGALFTALLFMLGKAGIGLYLGHSNIGLMYGAAASIVVILTWVYYSSIILYFGAEFTKAYALNNGYGIRPSANAVFIIKKESRELI